MKSVRTNDYVDRDEDTQTSYSRESLRLLKFLFNNGKMSAVLKNCQIVLLSAKNSEDSAKIYLIKKDSMCFVIRCVLLWP